MILSEVFSFTYRGKPAELRVIRNNGYCWGTVGRQQLSVSTRADQYDAPDEEAAEAFIRAARNPKCVAPTSLTFKLGSVL